MLNYTTGYKSVVAAGSGLNMEFGLWLRKKGSRRVSASFRMRCRRHGDSCCLYPCLFRLPPYCRCRPSREFERIACEFLLHSSSGRPSVLCLYPRIPWSWSPSSSGFCRVAATREQVSSFFALLSCQSAKFFLLLIGQLQRLIDRGARECLHSLHLKTKLDAQLLEPLDLFRLPVLGQRGVGLFGFLGRRFPSSGPRSYGVQVLELAPLFGEFL